MKKFEFPIVKNIRTKTIASDIDGVKPMSLEEAAKGRTIKPYPAKYDTFDSYELLKDYIENELSIKKHLKAEWLHAGYVGHLPLQLRKRIYYTGYESIQITCYNPEEHHHCIVHGELLCDLHPKNWDIDKIQNMLDEIKNNK